MAEVETLKQDLETFFLSVREYRGHFRRDAPFTFTGPVTQAYNEMDKQVLHEDGGSGGESRDMKRSQETLVVQKDCCQRLHGT